MSYRRSDIGISLSARDLVAVIGARSNIGAVLAQQAQMATLSGEAREGFIATRILPRPGVVGGMREPEVTVTAAPLVRRRARCADVQRPRSLISEFEKLADLKERGVITSEELVMMKNRLLGR
jgi:hypothetical protein